mmetsp:Transcript_21614/g.45471  ORF Transcript_21614/g.45471 Transcript_21614/m.45471 type:complete len:127 (+) Transcript_21614:124-504(+)|eukprot:CAMPEP_0171346432 /NCGR_PEP_ID=MMETSP0878-20121228/24823_1 /TAXON_ID=67004 /ORGANISM="Thalassiosira weissflogii, Strain CCMP1336" /LENGTH=126 /DNA_ID=CAMNT_0011850119 /DNA_START=108 /DNA_END=488 /DNA_ORIENTATION=-
MVHKGMMSLSFTCLLLSGTQAFTPSKFSGCKRSSPTSLDYLNGDDDVVAQEFYTDKLWATALRPHSKREVDRHDNDEKTPLELRPISLSLKKSKAPNNDLVETAKAFTLVAIEVSVVAAAAANNMY